MLPSNVTGVILPVILLVRLRGNVTGKVMLVIRLLGGVIIGVVCEAMVRLSDIVGILDMDGFQIKTFLWMIGIGEVAAKSAFFKIGIC